MKNLFKVYLKSGIFRRSLRTNFGLAVAWARPVVLSFLPFLCLPAALHAQTFTWEGGADDLFDNPANWAGGSVPGTGNNASDNTLEFGAESGATPNYINILNQGKKDVQDVGSLVFKSGAGAYKMNRAGVEEYNLFGVSAGSADPGDFNAIVNESSNLITFNVPITSNAQGGNSPQERSIWNSGTGGLLFNATTFYDANAKDLALRGSADIRFSAGIAHNNITGSSAVLEVEMDPAAKVEIDGKVTDLPGIRLISGTLYASEAGNVDIIDDRKANSRQTSLEMQGGTLLFADSGSQVAEFKGTLTMSKDSNVTGLVRSDIDLGAGGSVKLNFGDSSGEAWTTDSLLNIENWDGIPDLGGGNDQIIFGDSDASLTAAQVGQIRFTNPSGRPEGLYYAKILASGEIVPAGAVPEPATILAAFGLVAFFGWRERARLVGGWKRFRGH